MEGIGFNKQKSSEIEKRTTTTTTTTTTQAVKISIYLGCKSRQHDGTIQFYPYENHLAMP